MDAPAPGPHYLERELYERVRADTRIFDFLQQSCLDGIWYWDLENSDHEWMSPRFWELLGYAPGEKAPLASEWQSVIFPEDLKVALVNLEAHLADPAYSYDQVVRYLHKDGSTIWVRCRGIAIRDAEGRPIRMLGAHTDVTPLKRAEEELLTLTARAATEAVARAEEREREKLARDLHDDLGQLLALAAIKLAQLRDADAADIPAVVQQVDQLIREAQQRTHSLTFRLSPPLLHDVGLAPAVEWLAEEVERRYGLRVKVDDDGRAKALDQATRITFFRALRELVVNVARHARADVAVVRLWSDGADIYASVEDDGVGFDPSLLPSGFGLLSIRDRLQRLGGSMTIESNPGDGARIVLVAPNSSSASDPGREGP